MKSLLLAMAVGASLLVTSNASAVTFDFENPDTASFQRIGPDYEGFNFINWAVIDGPGFAPSGYRNVITSGQQSACGCAADFGQTITSISKISSFDLVGGNFASAWNNGATLLVEGYLGASLLYSRSFIVNTTGPSALTFGFNGINRVNFSISGGTSAGLSGSGNYFAVDDLKINAVAAVPEPATWMLMLMGMAGIGFSMRRKKDTTLRVRYA